MNKKARQRKTPAERKKPGAKQMPKEHPAAWAIQLWPHLRTIQTMRREMKTWMEIAQYLEAEHDVKITFRTVRNFFKRATDPARKRPLGFPRVPQPPPETTVPTSTLDVKERYLRSREQAEAPPIQPLSIIDPDDET